MGLSDKLDIFMGSDIPICFFLAPECLFSNWFLFAFNPIGCGCGLCTCIFKGSSLVSTRFGFASYIFYYKGASLS